MSAEISKVFDGWAGLPAPEDVAAEMSRQAVGSDTAARRKAWEGVAVQALDAIGALRSKGVTRTPSSKVEIPDAAREFYFRCGCDMPICDRAGYADDAFPLVVAAEFRRQAEAIRCESNKCSQLDARGLLLAARLLDDRADELDPRGGTR